MRHKEETFHNDKWSVHQEDNNPVFMHLITEFKINKAELTELKGDIDETIIIRDFNTPLSK